MPARCRAYKRIRATMSYPPQSAVLKTRPATSPAPRLLDEVRRHLRVKHYSLSTEAIYIGWIKRFILANRKQHQRAMGAGETMESSSSVRVIETNPSAASAQPGTVASGARRANA